MTTRRTIDPYAFFCNRALEHKPQAAFAGKTKADFEKWKKQTLPQVLATLGDRPAKVKPKPELMVQWEEDGLIKQRWVIDTQPGLSAVLLLFRPAGMKRGEKRPAILCCHGHGPHGKNAIMGVLTPQQIASDVTPLNYDYGLQMAKQGFVTFAIDLLGFGERSSRQKPHTHGDHIGARDECNINYLCATLLGTTPLAINTHDNSAAIDFVCDQPFVDPDRLGVMGLSQGGTMTTWMALTDERLKAVDILCYAGPFYDIAFRTYNVCGSQVAPSLYKLVDVGDLQGLIAPRPLLVELGIYDSCFHVDHTLNLNYRQIESIYKTAGCRDLLDLDLFPGPHAWGANKSVGFFGKHLAADWL
ncbi:MAG: prolyl oligopeptidase family serine peptidase [Phycisphaeraceae bacterium]|nr:prolyl oligopeptidase family serine peptidase [Phycisphaeraceae bacterium]